MASEQERTTSAAKEAISAAAASGTTHREASYLSRTWARLVADILVPESSGVLHLTPRRTREERKSELVAQLMASGVDPLLFDSLLSNEIDRRLKKRFGVVFVLLTFFFTSVSYAIVALNGPWKLNISNVAITGLIIETPLQFIGLLYIIARNLFPDGSTRPRQLEAQR